MEAQWIVTFKRRGEWWPLDAVTLSVQAPSVVRAIARARAQLRAMVQGSRCWTVKECKQVIR